MFIPVTSLPGPTPLSDYKEQIATPSRRKELSDLFEYATDQGPDEIAGRLEENSQVVEAEAKQLSLQGLSPAGQLVEQAIASGSSPEELRSSLLSHVSKADDLGKGKATLESYLVANQPGATEKDVRFALNRAMMERKLQERRDSSGVEEQGWAGTGWDFVDRYILRMVGQTYEDATNRTERLGTKLIDISFMDPAEAEAAMDVYLDEVANEGVLTGNNRFAFDQATRELEGMGYNPSYGLDLASSAFDVATGFTAGAASKVGSKLARSAMGKFNKIANVAGPVEAGEAAAKAIARSADPEAIAQAGTSMLNIEAPRSAIRTAARKSQLKTSAAIPPAATPNTPSQGLARLTHTGSPATGHTGFSTTPAIPNAHLIAGAAQANRGLVMPQSTAGRALRMNQLLEHIDTRYKSGWADYTIDPDKLEATKNKMVAGWTSRVSYPVFDAVVDTSKFQDHFLRVQFGGAEGAPYKDLASARKAAAQIKDRGAKAEIDVVQVDPLDVEQGFVLQVEERIKKAGKADALDNSSGIGALRRTISGLFSSQSYDDLSNYARASKGEGFAADAVRTSKQFEESIKSISADSRWTLNQIMTRLRDGVDADLKDYYDDTTFEQLFRQYHPQNRLPTEKEMDAYYAIIDIDETDYFIAASQLLNKFVESGYKAVVTPNEGRLVAKQVQAHTVPDGATILELNGRGITKANLKSGDVVYQLSQPIGNKGDIQYLLNPEDVTMLRYDDLLARNAGGRRAYKEKFFVVTQDANGNAVAKLTARTEKEARLAQKQLDTILRGINSSSPDLNRIIRENNDWNPSVHDEASFRKWAADNDMDLKNSVHYKADRGNLSNDPQVNHGGPPTLTWGERVAMQQARSNRALPGFGGHKASVEDPLSAIGEHFANSTYMLSNQAAIRQGIDGWVRAVLDSPSSTGWEIPQAARESGDFTRMFIEAQAKGATTETQRQLTDLRKVIENRHNITRQANSNDWVEEKLFNLGEFILDTGPEHSLVRQGLLKNAPLQYLGGRLVESDGGVMNNLLRMGFGATFGFFNVSQMLVQATHGAIMVPIIAGNGAAAKAFFAQGPIRAALASRGTATGAMINKRLAGWIGVPEADIDQLVQYMADSGRIIVGNEVLELGTRASSGIGRSGGTNVPPSALNNAMSKAGQLGSKLYDKSFMFYRAGEQYSRIATLSTAFFEYKKAFPNGNPFSAEGSRWITNRDQALGFHMTSAGRAQVQQGLGKFPTQWLAYPFRAAEAVFVGRGLTAGERSRAAFAATALWGTSGFGPLGDGYADYLGEKLGVEPGSATYTALKHGLLDGLMDGAGIDLALGDRLAPFKGVADLWNDLGTQSALETLGGPSGTIVGNGVLALMSTIGSVFSGQPALAWEDFERSWRTVSAVDYAKKAYDIQQYGYLRSKTGFKYEAEIDNLDTALIAAGFTTIAVQEENSRRSEMFRSKDKETEFRKKMSNLMSRALDYIGQEDAESKQAGFQLLRDMEVELSTSGLSLYQQKTLKKSLLEGQNSTLQTTLTTLYKQDKTYAAKAYERLLKGN